MPFSRPTVAKIRERRISDFEYELGSQSARLQGTVEHALATSGSGAAHGLHGHLDDVSKNAFPHLADDERLRQWASFFGVYQIEAQRSEGLAVFNATGVDTLMPAGTVWTRADGTEYLVVEDTVIVALGTATLIRAKVAGAAGDMPGGTELTIQTPLPGIQSTGTQFFDAIGGLDEETSSALRTRLLARLASPPKSGGPGDYISWAKLVPGVTRVWEYPHAPKVGYVTLLFMRDLDVDPFPGPASIAEVEAIMAQYAPVVAPPPYVQAPVKEPITLTIELTIEANAVLSEVRAAIYQSIRDMLLTRFEPLTTADVLYRSWITEAISTTPGEYNHVLAFPVGDYPIGAWTLPVLEDLAITWI
jgi:uncharacterized phage protein gp47/JayE